MGTHPIFESDFDCLTDTRKGNANIAKMKLELVDQESTAVATQEPQFSGKTELDVIHEGPQSKVTRKSYSLKFKLECLDYFQGHGKANFWAAFRGRVTMKTFHQWRKDEAKLRQFATDRVGVDEFKRNRSSRCAPSWITSERRRKEKLRKRNERRRSPIRQRYSS